MEALQRFIQAFLILAVGLTATAVVTQGGGGRFALTLAALVLLLAAVPYLAAKAVMRRFPERWAMAVGIATCLFGVSDVFFRMRAFFFPVSPLDGAMAIWIPLYSLAVIPGLAVGAYACIAASRRFRNLRSGS